MRNISFDDLQKKIQTKSIDVNNKVRKFTQETQSSNWKRGRSRLRTADEQNALDLACRGYIRNLMNEGKILYNNTPGERRMKIDGL